MVAIYLEEQVKVCFLVYETLYLYRLDLLYGGHCVDLIQNFPVMFGSIFMRGHRSPKDSICEYLAFQA
jgi:hypothetical protein